MKNFTRYAVLATGLFFAAESAKAQNTYATVGLIGPGSPANSWVVSDGVNALSQTTPTSHIWVGTKTMNADLFKFRADNMWNANWGGPASGSAFPNAVGTMNGPDVRATAGRYWVTINDQTGAYSFAPVSATPTRSASAMLGMSLAPNPAAEVTRIGYDLPTAADVTLTVVNQLGQVVRQLPTVHQTAGSQEQYLVRESLAAGLYLVQLQAGNQHQSLRLQVN